MTRVALLASLLACSERRYVFCTEEYWANRPEWVDNYYSSTHVSDDGPCVTSDDCRSMHGCVNGRCRAWCDCAPRADHWADPEATKYVRHCRGKPDAALPPPQCPLGERCLAWWNELYLGRSMHQNCNDFTGPEKPRLPTELLERSDVGGLCIPDSWLPDAGSGMP